MGFLSVPFLRYIYSLTLRDFSQENGVQLRGTFARHRPFLAHPLYPMCICMLLPSHTYTATPIPKHLFHTKMGFSFKVTTIGSLVQSSKQSYIAFLVTLYVQYKWELMTHIPGAICWSSVLLHFVTGQNWLHSSNVHNTFGFQGHKGLSRFYQGLKGNTNIFWGELHWHCVFMISSCSGELTIYKSCLRFSVKLFWLPRQRAQKNLRHVKKTRFSSACADGKNDLFFIAITW